MKKSKIDPVVRTLLAAAKRAKLDAEHLAGTSGLDYSSARRMLSGISARPSLAMITGLARVLGFKLKLIAAKAPKLMTRSGITGPAKVKVKIKAKPKVKRKPVKKVVKAKPARKAIRSKKLAA